MNVQEKGNILFWVAHVNIPSYLLNLHYLKHVLEI